jgi:hypothetical protein
MKKFTVLALLCSLTLGSCQAISLPTSPAPSVDSQGTVNAVVQTSNAQTLTAQPSPTTAPPTATVTPLLAEASPTTVTDTPTIDPLATFLTTTPATATSGPTATGLAPTATFTATAASSQLTEIPTLAIRTYGTLPPLNRPYTEVSIFNRTKAQCYISLQIVTDQGYTIIEYPVEKMVNVLIPTGEYTYVVWVGGRKLVGNFHASQGIESVINIYRDKVVIN